MKISVRALAAMKTFKKNIIHYSWWEMTVFVIGAISLASILAVFFLPLGTGPTNFIYTGDMSSVDSSEFAGLLSSSLNVPLKQGAPIEMLNNGNDFLAALLADIDNAHSSIDIMVYIWTDGKMSNQIFEHLNQKLKEGVQVRVMIDAYGSSTNTPDAQFSAFEKLGGKKVVFHSLTIAPWDLAKNQIRNHRRAIIIDGNIGYTGGMTVSDPWLGSARNPKEYRDTMFRTTGPMAHDIQGAFAELWASMTGEILVGNAFYPKEASTDGANTLSYIPLLSTPSPNSLSLQKFVLLSIEGAQQKIYMTTPYFLPDPSLRDVLIEKAKNGVDVRVLVPNNYNDSQSAHYASRYSYADLLDGGVKIYEYQPTFIHSKSIIIDGSWSIIGSANMDNRSRKFNEEDIFGVSDKVLGATLERTFFEDLNHAKQIDSVEWKKRNLWEHIKEIFALKFVHQY
jgi:cardiolipin synthase